MRTTITYLILLLSITNFSLRGQIDFIEAGKKVDSLFEHIRPDEPGYIVGVIKDGHLIYNKGFGSANLDYQIPMSAKSAFYMGSTSKQFTAACLLALVEQGKLNLEDDIRKYLPGFPDYGTTIRISNLLFHTSGVREYTSLMLQSGCDTQWEDKFSNDDTYRLICRQKELNFIPGSKYLYSSSNYILLSKIIENVSGKSLRQFADSTLFQPLGMTNTYFTDDHQEIIHNRVQSYKQNGDSYKRIVKTFGVYGDGGLISTLEDLVKWDKVFYSDLLSIPNFGYKLTRNGELNDGHRINYAWALQKHKYHGLTMIEHGGFMINYDSQMMRFPNQQFTVVVLSNCWRNWEGSSMNLSYQIADIYLSEKFRDQPLENSKVMKSEKPINPDAYTGYYWNINENYYNLIGQADGQLFYDNTNGWKPVLIPIASDLFEIKDSDITIHFAKDGMTMTDPSANNTEQYFKKFDPTPPLDISELIKYQGSYHSDELETNYEFIICGDALFLRINNNLPQQIYPAKDNVRWNTDNMVWIGFAEIIFTINAQEEVTGFSIGDSRVKGVAFKKYHESK